ncbi:MAG: YggU family protein [Betaproteobacteria bacterium]|nr:MAG: YggU family protein [Betaproteobacteria bacterium]TMI12156.1 MAG: YggU family protein [Betaproteobacteria bacterium]
MILELHVQPGASRSEFAGWHGERIRIRLAAAAVEGKANAALVEFLASYFGVPRRSVRIASGLKSRRKRVVIEGVSEWKPPTG